MLGRQRKRVCKFELVRDASHTTEAARTRWALSKAAKANARQSFPCSRIRPQLHRELHVSFQFCRLVGHVRRLSESVAKDVRLEWK